MTSEDARSRRSTRSTRSRRPIPGWLFIAGALLALAVAVAFPALAGSAPYEAVGNLPPGAAVRFGTPVLRLVVDLAATTCIGALAFVTLATRPREGGAISPVAYAQFRIGAVAGAVWAVGALLLVPFSAGDAAGLPLGRVLASPQRLGQLSAALEEPRAWLLSAVLAALVAAGCRMALRWNTGVLLFGTALLTLTPPLVTAHGSADVGHDLSLAGLLIHVPIAALWVGLLIALLVYVGRHGTMTSELAVRYSRTANICLIVLLASGIVPAVVLVDGADLVNSSYGAVLLGKAVLVVLVTVGVVVLRNRVTARLLAARADVHASRWRGLAQLLVVELLLLAGVFGLSTGLAHLNPPDVLGQSLGTQQTLLGFALPGPPTLWNLVTGWRVDVLFAPIAVLLALGYLRKVRRLRGEGVWWSRGRTACWLAGCVVLLVVTSSGIGRYEAAMFSVHMASHMVLSMLVPALLVLGAPLTLVRTGTGTPRHRQLPDARDWLAVAESSAPVRVLTHPAVALVLFVGSPFALYYTQLFDALARYHWGHLAVDAWFLLVGYLFTWVVIGVDRPPRALPNLGRLGMVLAAMPGHILFGALLVGTQRVIGNGPAAANMYTALDLPWVPDLLADQRLAGVLALVLGEAALFVILVALLVDWNGGDDLAPADVTATETRSEAPDGERPGPVAERAGASASGTPAADEHDS